MKIISLSILSIALSISLSARENPFEPTDHFLKQKKIIIQANELEKVKKEQEIENKIAQEIEAKKLLSENEAIKIIEMKKASEAQKMMKIKEQEEILSQKSKKDKAMEIAKLIKDSNSTETVMKKPYIPEIKENFKVKPLSNYALNKKLSEDLFTFYSNKYNLDILFARTTSIYGNGLKRQFIFDVCNKLTNNNINFFGTGNEIRDWIHVSDMCELIYRFIKKGFKKNNIVNCDREKVIK